MIDTSFVESQFPPSISYGAKGGPRFLTQHAINQGGFDQASIVQQYPLHDYDAATGLKSETDRKVMQKWMFVTYGSAIGFRWKDWADFSADSTEGILGSGVGTGMPTYQLTKRYSIAGRTFDRIIKKPVAGTIVPYRNAGAITAGVAAGNYAIDTTTGFATFVADSSATISAVTVGATTQVTLSSALSGLIVGGRLYLSGLTGADAGLLNLLAHPITVIAGAVYTLSTNTAGKTITLAGSGYKYPQPADVLTASFEFDVPVKFVQDYNPITITNPGTYQYGAIPVTEIRLP